MTPDEWKQIKHAVEGATLERLSAIARNGCALYVDRGGSSSHDLDAAIGETFADSLSVRATYADCELIGRLLRETLFALR
jgi:hypothetical protein